MDTILAETAPALATAKPREALDMAGTLRAMAAASGVSYLGLVKEFAGLAFGPGKLAFDEYVALGLFNIKDARNRPLTRAEKRAFVGLEASRRIWLGANYRPEFHGLADNKIAAAALFEAYGFPTIPTLALYCDRVGRSSQRLLRDGVDLRRFLAREEIYPLFGKPLNGLMSLGSAAFVGYEPARKLLVDNRGDTVTLDEFVAEVTAHYGGGYLFQKRVTPHAQVRAICGDRLATVRIVTALRGGEPQILRACWKIPAASNDADNFWRPGNLLATVEIDTGRVSRVVRGSGVALEELIDHPDTGAIIVGNHVPNWHEVCELALGAARLVKNMALVGWDVAPVDGGAVLVELNQNPDFILPQIADRRGMLDAEFGDFLAERRRHRESWTRAKRRGLKRSSIFVARAIEDDAALD